MRNANSRNNWMHGVREKEGREREGAQIEVYNRRLFSR